MPISKQRAASCLAHERGPDTKPSIPLCGMDSMPWRWQCLPAPQKEKCRHPETFAHLAWQEAASLSRLKRCPAMSSGWYATLSSAHATAAAAAAASAPPGRGGASPARQPRPRCWQHQSLLAADQSAPAAHSSSWQSYRVVSVAVVEVAVAEVGVALRVAVSVVVSSGHASPRWRQHHRRFLGDQRSSQSLYPTLQS